MAGVHIPTVKFNAWMWTLAGPSRSKAQKVNVQFEYLWLQVPSVSVVGTEFDPSNMKKVLKKNKIVMLANSQFPTVWEL